MRIDLEKLICLLSSYIPRVRARILKRVCTRFSLLDSNYVTRSLDTQSRQHLVQRGYQGAVYSPPGISSIQYVLSFMRCMQFAALVGNCSPLQCMEGARGRLDSALTLGARCSSRQPLSRLTTY